MDDSVSMHFEEAMIANNLTSEKEVNKLSDEYDSLSSDEKPPGLLNNVLQRSRRFSQLLGFWEGPSHTDPPVTTPIPRERSVAITSKNNKQKEKYKSTLGVCCESLPFRARIFALKPFVHFK